MNTLTKRDVWITTIRPKTLTMSLIPMLVGSFLAYSQTRIVYWHLTLFAILSSCCIQIGMHLINDCFDVLKGVDTKTRIGPKRLVHSGLLSPSQIYKLGICFLILVIAFGIPLMMQGGLPIFFVVTISAICGYCYTGGPWPISYSGFADLFCLAFYGFVAVASMFYIQTGEWNNQVLLAGAQIGFLATAALAIANFRDTYEDAKANKKTLSVRYGLEYGRYEISISLMIPYLLTFVWAYQGYWLAAILPWGAFPVAFRLLPAVWETPPSAIYNQFLAMAALQHLTFGLLLCLGIFLQ